MPTTASDRDASPEKGEAGPYDRLLRSLRVRRGAPGDLRRELEWSWTLTLLPVLVLATLDYLAHDRWEPLLADPSLYARLLLALPLLVLAEPALELFVNRALELNQRARLIGDHPADLRGVADWWARTRASQRAEFTAFLLAIATGQAVLWDWGAVHLPSRGAGPTVAVVWFASVSLSFVTFLFLRAAWRWATWCRVVGRLSRLPLRLVPTHADGCGGLGIVTLPLMAFALIVTGFSAAMSGAWAAQVLLEDAPLSRFFLAAAVLVVLALAAGLGPLFAFTPALFRARASARAEFDLLSIIYGRRFRERWSSPPTPPGDFLGTPDIQSLADLAQASAIARNLRLVPFAMASVRLVGIAVVLPLLPLLALQMPLTELLRTIGSAALGKLP